MKHQIIIEADDGTQRPEEALLERVITEALNAEDMLLPCEINVLLTGDEGIREINLEQRGIDAPTDVLSFPMFELTPGEHPEKPDADPATGLIPLGDMVISVERAAAQAAEFGHPLERELAYLTVHSILHLLGYDHMDEGAEKARMRVREEFILNTLGILREE
ncbi:MAG: rRNA maturation RNase YbeY [Oscillospiraceae bacterium]|nr:rRNA maturation RNase YbeY [Oscillospiraceae bacterium]